VNQIKRRFQLAVLLLDQPALPDPDEVSAPEDEGEAEAESGRGETVDLVGDQDRGVFLGQGDGEIEHREGDEIIEQGKARRRQQDEAGDKTGDQVGGNIVGDQLIGRGQGRTLQKKDHRGDVDANQRQPAVFTGLVGEEVDDEVDDDKADQQDGMTDPDRMPPLIG